MLSNKTAMVVVVFLIPLGLLAYYAFMYRSDLPISSNPQTRGSIRVLTLNGFPVKTEVVNTRASREKGLSGRAHLASDEGMLFVFEVAGYQGIWMKDMRFPIDILWLSEKGIILDIKSNALPESYPEVFYPKSESSYVLELPARFTELHSVKVGDDVALPADLSK